MFVTRRQLLASSSAALLMRRLRAGAPLPRMLPDYLRRLASEAYDTRERAMAALTTPDAIRERQRWARDTFWKIAGGMPERTPLNARKTGEFERATYRVEKIIYESRPGLHIPALVYIPKTGKPPYPGVLFQMGHSANGKAYASYQKCCQGLVQLGFLTVAFDPMGQGERVYYPREGSTVSRLTGGPDDEHSTAGKQMLLAGMTATQMQAWDAVRSLDYLASHPLVDAERLATTGQSGGGTLSMMLVCVDERLSAAAVSCGNTENFACRDFLPPGSTDDAEQDFINSGPLGFDRWDMLYPIAPKPLLVAVSAHDWTGTYSPRYIENGRAEFARLREIYTRLDHADRIAWYETPLPHGLEYALRVQVYQWLTRWLQPGAPAVTVEPPVAPEPDALLNVTHEGNVVRAFNGSTPARMCAAYVPPAPPKDAAALARDVHAQQPPERPAVSLSAPAPSSRGVNVRTMEVSGPDTTCPAWLFEPSSAPAKATFLIFDPHGRNLAWHEGDLFPSLAAAGYRVCAPDLRGIGDLRPEYSPGNPGYEGRHEAEEEYAWASLMLGRPLLGQRVTDMLLMAAAVPAGAPLYAAARGKTIWPALLAATLNPRIERVYIAGEIPSVRTVLKTENYQADFGNFAWRLADYSDFPDMARSLGKRVRQVSTLSLQQLTS